MANSMNQMKVLCVKFERHYNGTKKTFIWGLKHKLIKSMKLQYVGIEYERIKSTQSSFKV